MEQQLETLGTRFWNEGRCRSDISVHGASPGALSVVIEKHDRNELDAACQWEPTHYEGIRNAAGTYAGLDSNSIQYETDCKTPGCIKCAIINYHEKCLLCYGPNLGANAGGSCEPCKIGNCYQCNSNSANCELCTNGNPPVNNICSHSDTACADDNCVSCSNNPFTCLLCQDGFFWDEISCTPCWQIHYRCTSCYVGYCTDCAEKIKPGASICIACDIVGCKTCEILSDVRDRFYSMQCIHCYDGYLLVDGGTMCIRSSETSCNIPNCKKCTDALPPACLECEPAYYLLEGGCIICFIPNCNDCKIMSWYGSIIETCASCEEGFLPLEHEIELNAIRVLCIPEFKQALQYTEPTIFIAAFFVIMGLVLLSAGCTALYKVIEENEDSDRENLGLTADAD